MANQDRITPVLAVVALMAVCALAWVVLDQNMLGTSMPDGPAGTSTAPDMTVAASFTMCGRHRYTCVVDGDTIWIEGQNLRLQSFDTPEPPEENRRDGG